MLSPLKWRLDIDEEFQGWILVFSTLIALNVYCLPCQCAGSSWSCVRRCANFVQQHLPIYLFFATIVNAVILFLIVTWMPDWAPMDYVKCLLKSVGFLAKNAMKFMVSIAIIVAFIFVVTFKDRFMKLAGLDHKTVFRFKLRDVFGSGNMRAIELQVWKVEDLQNKNMFAPNNVYIETHLGYNEPMKTRVHNKAGTSCIMKESLQMNFDEDEEEEPLYIFVKNQKVMGADELGRLELDNAQVAQLQKECAAMGASGDPWSSRNFIEKQLLPRGKIWFRINHVQDEDGGAMC